MDSKISLEIFKNDLDLVKRYISESSSKDVTRIEYRTFDEGMCEANIFTILKASVRDEFEAFVTLLNFQLHFYEEWMLSDTSSKNADSILNLWMQPEIESYSFECLTENQVHKEVDWIIDAIRKLLYEHKGSDIIKKDSKRWGIYVNNEPVSNDTELSDLGIGEIISGIGFNLEWNSVDIMYKTVKSYVFFSWGTGA